MSKLTMPWRKNENNQESTKSLNNKISILKTKENEPTKDRCYFWVFRKGKHM